MEEKNCYSLHILLNSSKLLPFWPLISFFSAFDRFIELSSIYVCVVYVCDVSTSLAAAVIAAKILLNQQAKIDRHFIKLRFVYVCSKRNRHQFVSLALFLVTVQRHPIIHVAVAIVVVAAAVVLVDLNILRVQSH